MAGDPPIEARRGVVELPSTDGIVPAIAEHGAVLVRSLRLGERAQIRLAASLGRVVVGARRGVAQVRYEDTHVEDPGQIPHNEQWHADLSWCLEGPPLTLLYAAAAGPGCVGTDLLDTRAAYAALPEDRRQQICGWRAHHHVERSREGRVVPGARPPARPTRLRDAVADRRRTHPDAVAPTFVAAPGAERAVVQEPPGIGHPCLALGDHAWTLAGLDEERGRVLLRELHDEVAALSPLQRHAWRQGDLLVFDNRVMLHRRQPRTDPGPARTLRRCLVWRDLP